MQRFDAERVAGEHGSFAIDDGERVHPPQVLDAPPPVFLVGAQNDLGIARGVEAVSARAEHGAKLAVVVDLAVEDEDGAATRADQRLIAGREVDDPQAGGADVCMRPGHRRLMVGAPVAERGRHRRDRAPVVYAEDARDTAHSRVRLLWRGRRDDWTSAT